MAYLCNIAKQTVIFRQGTLDRQKRELDTSDDYYNDNEVKKELTIIYHYKRKKKEDKKPEEMDEFILDDIEYRKNED